MSEHPNAVPDAGRLDLDDVLQRHRNVARALSENGTSEEALRGWRAFAGWLRNGMPDEPDVRGPVPDTGQARTDDAARVREIFDRAGTLLDGDDALDAELLETANKSGGSLVMLHRGHTDEVPYAALGQLITVTAALRAVLGYSATPTPRELMEQERASSEPRPAQCPECREIGLCDEGCAVAEEKGWPRDAKWAPPATSSPSPDTVQAPDVAALLDQLGGRHCCDARMGHDDERCMSCPDEAWPCPTSEIGRRLRALLGTDTPER